VAFRLKMDSTRSNVNDYGIPCSLIKNAGGIIAVSRAISEARDSVRKIVVSDAGWSGLARGDGLIRLRRNERGTRISDSERKTTEFRREIFSHDAANHAGHIMCGTHRNRIRRARGSR